MQSTVQCPRESCVSDDREGASRKEGAYDPNEFTPFVLHFENKLAPPVAKKRPFQCPVQEEGVKSLLVLTNDEINVHRIQR